jgi:hypothetical protein
MEDFNEFLKMHGRELKRLIDTLDEAASIWFEMKAETVNNIRKDKMRENKQEL